MAENTVPEWAEAYAQELRDLFGLGDWNIYPRQEDRPNGAADSDGCAIPDVRYLTASIILRRGLAETRGRHVLMHEMLHIVLAPLRRQIELLIQQLPEDQQDYALTLCSDAEEQIIERLTRAMQQHIKPSETKEVSSEAE